MGTRLFQVAIQWVFRTQYGNTWERTDEEIFVPANTQAEAIEKIQTFIEEETSSLKNEQIEVVSSEIIAGPSFFPLFDGGNKPLSKEEIQDLYGFDCYWPACKGGGVNLSSFRLGDYPACKPCNHQSSCTKHARDVDRMICEAEEH